MTMVTILAVILLLHTCTGKNTTQIINTGINKQQKGKFNSYSKYAITRKRKNKTIDINDNKSYSFIKK